MPTGMSGAIRMSGRRGPSRSIISCATGSMRGAIPTGSSTRRGMCAPIRTWRARACRPFCTISASARPNSAIPIPISMRRSTPFITPRRRPTRSSITSPTGCGSASRPSGDFRSPPISRCARTPCPRHPRGFASMSSSPSIGGLPRPGAASTRSSPRLRLFSARSSSSTTTRQSLRSAPSSNAIMSGA